jgi:hypothetical protein
VPRMTSCAVESVKFSLEIWESWVAFIIDVTPALYCRTG